MTLSTLPGLIIKRYSFTTVALFLTSSYMSYFQNNVYYASKQRTDRLKKSNNLDMNVSIIYVKNNKRFQIRFSFKLFFL